MILNRCLLPPSAILLLSSLWLTPAASAKTLRLQLPLACEVGRSCFIQNYVDIDPSPASSDYKCGTMTYNDHNGIDFRLLSRVAQRNGVNVLAAAGGRVARVRDGVEDVPVRGDTRNDVRGIECGNGVFIEHSGDWQTQYCHMAKGSLQVKPGDVVEAGQVLGRVGLSGMTEYPHLHFTLRRSGKVADPFAWQKPDGACDGGENMWDSSLRAQLAYHERTVLNFGFATGPVIHDEIDEEKVDLPSSDAPAMVVYIRTAGLKTGDGQSLKLTDPAGHIVAEGHPSLLDNNKAQYLMFAGKKRPESGWPRGTYTATYLVTHGGESVLEKRMEFELK